MMMSKPLTGTVNQADSTVKDSTNAEAKEPAKTVEDLEERLAALGGPANPPAPGAVLTDDDEEELQSKAINIDVQPVSNGALKGGKNALLARIMAAQERAKHVQGPDHDEAKPPASSPSFAISPLAAAPSVPSVPSIPGTTDSTTKPTADPLNWASPAVFGSPMLPTQEASAPPPPSAPTFSSAGNTFQQLQSQPAATPPDIAPIQPSAPDFDLLNMNSGTPSQSDSTPLHAAEHATDPTSGPLTPEEEVIMGMEGLTEEERRALIEEQRSIMEQIEKEKAANEAAIAAAAADEFDQRSAPAVARAAGDASFVPPSARSQPSGPNQTQSQQSSNRKVNLGGGQQVALHGPERTKAAIADGTAILVQCVNCQNWMQVTSSASLMYCPVCTVVSPVEVQNAASSKEEAQQMTADRKLAEELQNKEYQEGTQREDRVKAEATRTNPQPQQEESWWDTLTSMFTVKPDVPASVAVGIQQRRPPAPGSFKPARTSDKSEDDEGEKLLSSGGPARTAKVAEKQPMFACVVDSVSSAASSLGTALNTQLLQEDSEGNVHGVDASSLLTTSNTGSEPASSYKRVPNEE